MGYRCNIPPKPDPDDLLPVFDVTNREIVKWSIPCFYLDVEKPIDWHDPKCHDHHGWPRPGMPDHVCQSPWEHHGKALSPYSFWQYVDMDKAVKIHFRSEYEQYVSLFLVFDEYDEEGAKIDTSDIQTLVRIRDEEDWIIDVTFYPKLAHFAGKPKEFIFNLYATTQPTEVWQHTDDDIKYLATDLVVRGKLVVLPG